MLPLPHPRAGHACVHRAGPCEATDSLQLCMKDLGSRCHGTALALVAVLYSLFGFLIKLNGFFKTRLEALVF